MGVGDGIRAGSKGYIRRVDNLSETHLIRRVN